MSRSKAVDRTVLFAAVLGSLVLLNVLGIAVFGRLDLTRDKQFTLSAATLDTLRQLHEPLTVRAYFTKDLPPPHATNARYVRDLLDSYYAHGHSRLRYEFIDPVGEESAADREKKKDVRQDIFGRQMREATAMEQELQALGIPPVQVRVNEDDKLEVKRAYMGLAVQYGDKKEVIPVVSETAGLEYDLTTLIRKLTREHSPKVALVRGHEGLSQAADLGRAYGMLGELYDTTQVDLAAGPVPDDVAALLVVGPEKSFSEAERRSLDAYITGGHAAALLLGPIKPDLQTLQSVDNHHGLGDMLHSYGIRLGDGLVLDAECATISVAQQAGFMRINQPVRYPLMPVPRSLEQHPLTRGLAQVAFPFTAPLTVTVPEGSPVRAEVLVRSSADSWVQPAPHDLDPMQRWAPPAGGAMAPQNLVATLSGPLKSFFDAAPAGAQNSEAAEAPPARLLVAGGGHFITDPFFGKTNEALLLNLVDWLVGDDGLLAVRSRGLGAAALHAFSDTTRNGVKYFNIVGLPCGLVGFGLVRWRRREARRSRVRVG